MDPVAVRALCDTVAGTDPAFAALVAAEQDGTITAYLNTPRKGVTVAKGRVDLSTFLAEWLPLHQQVLDANSLGAWLRTVTSSVELDLEGPGIAPTLDLVGYPRTREASLAEQAFGAGATVSDALIGAAYADDRFAAAMSRDGAYIQAQVDAKLLADQLDALPDGDPQAAQLEQQLADSIGLVKAFVTRRNVSDFGTPDPAEAAAASAAFTSGLKLIGG